MEDKKNPPITVSVGYEAMPTPRPGAQHAPHTQYGFLSPPLLISRILGTAHQPEVVHLADQRIRALGNKIY